MALPALYTPSEPQIGEPVASGPAKITANFQALADFLGIPTNPPNQLNAPAFSITSGGVVTILQSGASLAANPTGPLGIATKQYADRVNKAVSTTSSGDAYTVVNPSPLSGLVDGLLQSVKWDHTNTTATPTLNVDNLGALVLAGPSGAPVLTGGLVKNHVDLLIYDAVSNQWIVLTAGPVMFRNPGNPAVDIVNTTANTAIFNQTIAGGAMGAYSRIRATLIGDYWDNSQISGGPPPVIITVYLNGGLLFNSGTAWAVGSNYQSSRVAVKGVIEIANRGLTNAQWCHMNIWQGGTLGAGVAGALAMGNGYLQGFNGAGVDTTAAVTLQVNVQLPHANPSTEFRLWDSYIELLN